MTGILLAGHGSFASGLLHASTLFFGTQPQLAALELHNGDDAQAFRTRMTALLAELDTGDGCMILTDLFGGTPCNCAMALQSERVRVLAGVNLPMLMEALSQRDIQLDAEMLAQAGRDGILFTDHAAAGEDEDF